MKRFLLLLATALCALPLFASTATTDSTAIKPRPRLILHEGDMETVHKIVATDPAAARLHRFIARRADKYLTEPVQQRTMEGRRLLTISRRVEERVLYCAYMYLYTGDRRYAERAEAEMLAAADFSDWNPSHFLDVAEMTAALAIGYDWLYDVLPEPSRRRIADAIINKGLLGAQEDKQMWFYRSTNNWNQVCNGGLVMGALAVRELRPDLAEAIVRKALTTNPKSMHSYAPDGIYPEGYGYWAYGTWYEVLMIEALRSVRGESADLERSAGFLASAEFMNYMVAPSGKCFNFSDSAAINTVGNPLLYWFAAETGNPSLAWAEAKRLVDMEQFRVESPRMMPFAMLFASRCDMSQAKPLDSRFWAGRGAMPLFIYRSGWDRADDTYLAAKGGSPSHSHAHMDAGSFVYEWGGVRWAIDLGSQNYHSLEKRGIKLFAKGQESPRWSIFRLNNTSHGTLMINDRQMRYEGKAEMRETYSDGSCYGALFDLTPVLFDVAKAQRRITIDEAAHVVVEDDLTAGDKPCSVRWTMVTRATPRIVDNHTIELRQEGRTLLVRVASPKATTPFVLTATPPHDYDAPNPDTYRIGFTTNIKRGKHLCLRVELQPVEGRN